MVCAGSSNELSPHRQLDSVFGPVHHGLVRLTLRAHANTACTARPWSGAGPRPIGWVSASLLFPALQAQMAGEQVAGDGLASSPYPTGFPVIR